MPSVAPQHTVISRSGSTSSEYVRRYLAAMASRNGFAPQVIAYWLMSAEIAARAASLSSSGAPKSGKPWARFTAPWRNASRVISRMTDSVNWLVRLLRKRSRLRSAGADKAI